MKASDQLRTVAKQLGLAFRARRRKLRFTPHQLALRSGVSKRAIMDFELGEYLPNDAVLKRLTDALDDAQKEVKYGNS